MLTPQDKQRLEEIHDDKLYRVIGSCPLNFYPGTVDYAPKGYRREVASKPMSMSAARFTEFVWCSTVQSPGWEFRIEPVASLTPTPEQSK